MKKAHLRRRLSSEGASTAPFRTSPRRLRRRSRRSTRRLASGTFLLSLSESCTEPGPNTRMKLFLKHATEKVIVYRSMKVALVVGSVLALINHYDRLTSGVLTTKTILQIGLTYLVPYAVSTYGSAMQARHLELKGLRR